MPNNYDELVERIERLEQRSIQVADLPQVQLQSKLELDWFDPQRAAITDARTAADISELANTTIRHQGGTFRADAGVVTHTLQLDLAPNETITFTVSHDLGAIPHGALVMPRDGGSLNGLRVLGVTDRQTNQFSFQIRNDTGFTLTTGQSHVYAWLAFYLG